MMKVKMLSIQKMMAMMIAALIMVLSVSSYQMNAGAANTERYYRVYNAQTGSLMRRYDLDPLGSYDYSRAIIGEEDRVIDWSKNGTVKILSNYIYDGKETTSVGTGFIVDDYVIATAAHCVYDVNNKEGNTLGKIEVYKTNGELDFTANAVEFHIPMNYATSSSYNGNYDYALITVDRNLSEHPHYELGVALDSATSQLEVKLSGFPRTVNDIATNGELYTGTGNLIHEYYTGDYQLCFTCDTSWGNSGGPVYVEESRCGYTYLTAIAIMTSGPDTYCVGTRITTDLIHFYKNNPNLNL